MLTSDLGPGNAAGKKRLNDGTTTSTPNAAKKLCSSIDLDVHKGATSDAPVAERQEQLPKTQKGTEVSKLPEPEPAFAISTLSMPKVQANATVVPATEFSKVEAPIAQTDEQEFNRAIVKAVTPAKGAFTKIESRNVNVTALQLENSGLKKDLEAAHSSEKSLSVELSYARDHIKKLTPLATTVITAANENGSLQGLQKAINALKEALDDEQDKDRESK